MSKRHRTEESVPLPRAELRAHAHAERHRVKGELHGLVNGVQHGMEVDDCDEPGAEWKPAHHHDAAKAKKASAPRPLRHWKVKEWKRRSAVRRAKAQAFRLVAEQA